MKYASFFTNLTNQRTLKMFQISFSVRYMLNSPFEQFTVEILDEKYNYQRYAQSFTLEPGFSNSSQSQTRY